MTHPLRRLIAYSDQHKPTVRLAATYSVLNKVFDLAPPVLIGAAIDVVVESDQSFIAGFGVTGIIGQLSVLAVLTVIVWGAESIFEYAYALKWRALAQKIQHGLRIDAYSHMQDLDLAFFEERSSGELMSVLNDDVNQLERFLDGGANDLLQVGTTVVVIGTAFFLIAPGVAVLSFLPVPFILWGSFRFQKHIAPRYALVRDRVGNLNGLLSNNLGGIATIKSFVAERREVERVSEQSNLYQEANTEAIRLSSAFSPLIRMVIVVGFTATLVYGGWLAEQGAIAVGAYGVLVFLTQRLLWPLTRLGETFDLFQRAMASTNRVLDVLEVQPEVVGGDKELSVELSRGDLCFEDVTFSYPRREQVLDHLDMQFEAGQTTAIVGTTGSGKSTVVKLLLRYYDPTEGRVTLGGESIDGFSLAALRGSIGLVSQDVFLFFGTVRENILYGRPDATQEDVEAAAKAAEAHDFVMSLQDKYDTVVGERGQRLSGGQRQRISLARAVLKDPAILVLDEATSAVDNETEAAIQRSLLRISEGRTTIVIAHRLSTVVRARRIYVLEHGRVVESGSHEELLSANGAYAGLWLVQSGGQSGVP